MNHNRKSKMLVHMPKPTSYGKLPRMEEGERISGRTMSIFRILLPIICILMFGFAVTSCGFRPLLYDVAVSPSIITPNADGITDVTRISYKLSDSALLSIYLIDQAGETHYFRYERPRSNGEYRVDFGGVIEGAMLPDGDYTWVVEAIDDSGEVLKSEGTLTLSDADDVHPELQGFSVFPKEFTPNRDGINDRVKINYDLNKTADVQVYLLAPDGETRYPIAEKERDIEPGEPGIHEYDYEGGVDLGADPPPDGEYVVWAEAVDQVGNRTVVTDTLTIAEGGVPRADIVKATVDFYNQDTGGHVVLLEQTLAFTLTVENRGTVPIRTVGPNSGTAYTSSENFNTKGVAQSSGAWRVGIDYEGNPSYPYPYRWSVGSMDDLTQRTINGRTEYFLMPGQRTLVTGSIQLVDVPIGGKDVINFWAGLIHEDVAIQVFNDHVDPTPINIGF